MSVKSSFLTLNKLAKLEDVLAPLIVTLCHNLKCKSLTDWLTDGVTTRDASASKKWNYPDFNIIWRLSGVTDSWLLQFQASVPVFPGFKAQVSPQAPGRSFTCAGHPGATLVHLTVPPLPVQERFLPTPATRLIGTSLSRVYNNKKCFNRSSWLAWLDLASKV